MLSLPKYLSIIKIIGGLILFHTTINLIIKKRFQKRINKRNPITRKKRKSIIFPLAFPLFAGSGSILVSILLSIQAKTTSMKILFYMALFFAFFINYLIALHSDKIHLMLGKSVYPIAKLIGLGIALVGLGLMLDGLNEFFIYFI